MGEKDLKAFAQQGQVPGIVEEGEANLKTG